MGTERGQNTGMEAYMESQQRLHVNLASKIYKEYGEFIYAVIHSNIHCTSEADDIFQEFYLSLIYRPIPQNISNVKSYLYRAIINDILDKKRKVQSYQTRLLKCFKLRKIDYERTNLLNSLMKTEQAEKVLEIINRHLPKHEGYAIIQRCYYGRDTAEVAEELGLNKRSLSRYLCTGLKKLKKLINHQCDGLNTKALTYSKPK